MNEKIEVLEMFDRRPHGLSTRANLHSISTMRNVFALVVLSLMLLTGVGQAESASAGGKLDLNRATADQLESLPGIGAVKAAAILAVRESRGGFSSMEELEAVRGIGPALVKKLEPFVVLKATKARSGNTTGK